jgi:hypothetical protein
MTSGVATTSPQRRCSCIAPDGGRSRNAGDRLEGFAPYPASWPQLGAPAAFRTGAIEGLVGQLEFNYKLGNIVTVAVPLADVLPAELDARSRAVFAFVVHEAFHQFQVTAFAGVDSPAEELYPILDARNATYAALELRALADAVQAAERADSAAAYLREEFASRLDDGALAPVNVPRNRIYPVAASIGVLLDFLGADWKRTALLRVGRPSTM